MKMKSLAVCILLMGLLLYSSKALASFAQIEISPESKKCIDCHKNVSAALYQQWGNSKHYGANIGCYECHSAVAGDPDVFEHYDAMISVIVSPKDCGRCHEKEVTEFTGSHHSKAGRILGSLDNVLAEVVEGNRGLKTASFPQGVSAAAVNGCWQCHGSEVKVIKGGTLDPATWPNTGIGRINPDGSEGSCTACHSRHAFSVSQARQPDNCGKCHMGPDHPQIEIYNESKHGIAYRANVDKMALDNSKWVLGEDYEAAPTCATCHMSAAKGVKSEDLHYAEQPLTHDVGMRISWNNRPAISVRPELSDAKMNLPGQNVPWTTRRSNMVAVCVNCHNGSFVTAFYTQYDGLIDLYHEKFAKPGLALYKASAPLRSKPGFSDPIDWTWFEIWHHEGRRARHGASMLGPDYTHWHGTYEVAKHFYAKYIPELEELVEKHIHSDDTEKKAAAEGLQALIDETLNHENHQWFLNKLSPEEKARRDAARQEFQKRYK
jgi:hypothetical protein